MRDCLNDALAAVRALRMQAEARESRDDVAVVETPVALLYNGLSFAVMMATPCDLEDFALGFALSEGVVASADEFRLADIVRGQAGVALHAAIPQSRYDALQQRRRNLEGRSGCGLCGVEALQDAQRPVPRVPEPVPIAPAQIRSALQALVLQQPLNARSGGVHAAGFVHAEGLLVREDVGRHNALDKLIGAMLRKKLDPATGVCLITSRCSYEMVQKAVATGFPILVAVSAPTLMARRLAEAHNLTLIALARHDSALLVSHPERVY